MRIAALGDAHLGRAYYAFTAEGGVNQRERDFELAFEAAVETALSVEPELIIWLGDIFDHPRPTYRSFRVAQRALSRIRAHGVDVVAISGNHDTPRLPGTGSPYSVLADTFTDVCFAHRLAYERFDFPGLVVHAVPQMMSVEHTLAALAEVSDERSIDRTNLLITHPRIKQVEPGYADINEIELDASDLKADLVLLGHYHFPTNVGRGMWYAGSTDTFSFADNPEKPKGIMVVDTDEGSFTHVPVRGLRPLVTMEPVQAWGRSPAEVADAVMARAAAVPAGSVARLYLEGVDPEAYRLLDLAAVRDAARAGLYLKIEPQFAATLSRVELPELSSIPSKWGGYVDGQDLAGFDRERLRSLGSQYLSAAVEEADC
ncbi:MAG: metallophosphoesterase family protein [Acidimicrobiales bacterium]